MSASATTLGPLAPATGTFPLPASKSLANRALVLAALAGNPDTRVANPGDAADVVTMQRLLGGVADGATLDVGPAGTTYRFLAAYLTTQPGTQTLTGSARMLERPIGPLVDALRHLGARIDYLGAEGYPPLRIGEADYRGATDVTIAGDVSSQYLSALLMLGAVLPQGLDLHWTGELVSRPYLEMTAALARRFGAEARVGERSARVSAGCFGRAVEYRVESDWSAASYAAAWVALGAVGTEWTCPGLDDDSLQGDRQLTAWIAHWGVDAGFDESGVRFRKTRDAAPATFECDFETSPDLAQTFAVLCACTGTTGLFTGLQTLSIKETDRIAALKTELAKAGVYLSALPSRFAPNSTKQYYMQEGRAEWTGPLTVDTYHDHRMAMAFSLLASRGELSVVDPDVVRKSFPGYWSALAGATRAGREAG